MQGTDDDILNMTLFSGNGPLPELIDLGRNVQDLLNQHNNNLTSGINSFNFPINFSKTFFYSQKRLQELFEKISLFSVEISFLDIALYRLTSLLLFERTEEIQPNTHDQFYQCTKELRDLLTANLQQQPENYSLTAYQFERIITKNQSLMEKIKRTRKQIQAILTQIIEIVFQKDIDFSDEFFQKTTTLNIIEEYKKRNLELRTELSSCITVILVAKDLIFNNIPWND